MKKASAMAWVGELWFLFLILTTDNDSLGSPEQTFPHLLSFICKMGILIRWVAA